MIRVNDLMTTNPVTASPDMTIPDLWGLMRAEGCRQLPIVDEDRLVGIVTERDILAVKQSPIFEKGTAETIMTSNPITVSPDTPAYRAAAMLNAYKFNALPVVDKQILVGIITTSNFLAQYDMNKFPLLVEKRQR